MLASVGRERLRDDPVRSGVLAVRRVPLVVRRPLARALVGAGRRSGRPALHALGLVVADRPGEAVPLLTGRPVRGRLGTELAVELGLPLPADADPRLAARRRWHLGDMGGAVALAGSSDARAGRRQAERLASERLVHTPGHRLAVPTLEGSAGPRPPVTRAPGGPSVLHLLTNSLPWTQSGYALRSHAVLRAQRDVGVDARAVTRVGYPVTVGLPWAADRDVVDGVPYHRLLPPRLARLPEQRLEQTAAEVARLARTQHADVLHTTTHFVNGLVVEAAAHALGRPWVYEMRGQLERTWVAGHPAAERDDAAASERYRSWKEREVEMARAADHVVVLSEVLRRHVVGAGVAPDRVTVVPNAVDAALLTLPDDGPEAARQALGLPEDGLWVGTVSSLVGYEGLDVLLEAVALLRADGLDVRCALVGDGVARPGLERLADDLGIADHVVLPGRVDRSVAPDWHRALDVFAVPRRDTEVARTVTPLKPVEAMALGRPVVASDLPALAEVVGHDDGAGLLARADDPRDLADRLRALSADPALRADLAGRGRRVAAARTWQAMADRYLAVYESVGSTR
ncbi:glycosyltransferase [Phycicoccus sp. BSK3Z-2]|uniref:Glycosyltransferase n=2 Tax=Phycicoccus avicenniae TaxID=2828860 RepID=A0A941D662_9MICO|nr:glycosyltransferase [Phycicoccus avicenniae]